MKTVNIPGGQVTLRQQGEFRGKERKLLAAARMAAATALSGVDTPDRLPGEATAVYSRRIEPIVRSQIAERGLSWRQGMAIVELQQATVVASVVSWTLDIPIPTMDTIDELPEEIYDALQAETGALAQVASATVDFDPGDPGAPDFENSPTSPSGSFAGHLRDEGEQSTPSQQNGSAPIAIAESFQP